VAAGVMFAVTAAAFFLVREPTRTARQRSERLGIFEVMRRVLRLPGLRTTVLAMMAVQGVFQATNQIMPLQLYAISGDDTEATARVGAAFTATALGTTLGAWLTGRMAKRFSSRILVAASAALGAVALGLMFWFQEPLVFPLLRFVQGVSLGCSLPALRTALAEQARPDEGLSASFGSLYGFSGSAQQGGMAVGAVVLSVFANLLGLTWIYAVSGIALALATVLWMLATRDASWRFDPDSAGKV
jgi:MFS family permease